MAKRSETLGVLYNDPLPATVTDLTNVGVNPYPWPAAPTELAVSSSSVADTDGGATLEEVEVNVLDATFNSTTVLVPLNGVTPVPVPGGPWYRCNGMWNSRGIVPTGIISLTTSPGGDVLAQISAGSTRSRQIIYTMPSDETITWHTFRAVIENAQTANDDMVVSILRRGQNRSWVSWVNSEFLSSGFHSSSVGLFDAVLSVGSDLKGTVLTNSNSADCYCQVSFTRHQKVGAL